MKNKEIKTCFDMDQDTAKMFEPVDKYLKQTKRFTSEARKSQKIAGVIGYIFVLLFILGFGGTAVYSGRWKALPVLIFIGLCFIGTVMGMKDYIQNLNTVTPPDMQTCKRLLDEDGAADICEDYSRAEKLTGHSVIGSKYIFIKGRTVVRLTDITDIKINPHGSRAGPYYNFCIYVKNQLGGSVYELETLSDNKEKQEQRCEELKRIIENKQTIQKRLEVISM